MFRRVKPHAHAFLNRAKGELFDAVQLVFSASRIGQTLAELRQKNSHLGRVAVRVFGPRILLEDRADLTLATVPAVTQFVPYRRALGFDSFDIRVKWRNNY